MTTIELVDGTIVAASYVDGTDLAGPLDGELIAYVEILDEDGAPVLFCLPVQVEATELATEWATAVLNQWIEADCSLPPPGDWQESQLRPGHWYRILRGRREQPHPR